MSKELGLLPEAQAVRERVAAGPKAGGQRAKCHNGPGRGAVTAAPEVTELTHERRPGGLARVTDNYRHTVKLHPRRRCVPVLLQTQPHV